jgi:hypothetical protein
VIVLIVQYVGVSVFEFEGQSPVSADPYRPSILRPTFERMEPITWHVHILDYSGGIESR